MVPLEALDAWILSGAAEIGYLEADPTAPPHDDLAPCVALARAAATWSLIEGAAAAAARARGTVDGEDEIRPFRPWWCDRTWQMIKAASAIENPAEREAFLAALPAVNRREVLELYEAGLAGDLTARAFFAERCGCSWSTIVAAVEARPERN